MSFDAINNRTIGFDNKGKAVYINYTAEGGLDGAKELAMQRHLIWDLDELSKQLDAVIKATENYKTINSLNELDILRDQLSKALTKEVAKDLSYRTEAGVYVFDRRNNVIAVGFNHEAHENALNGMIENNLAIYNLEQAIADKKQLISNAITKIDAHIEEVMEKNPNTFRKNRPAQNNDLPAKKEKDAIFNAPNTPTKAKRGFFNYGTIICPNQYIEGPEIVMAKENLRILEDKNGLAVYCKKNNDLFISGAVSKLDPRLPIPSYKPFTEDMRKEHKQAMPATPSLPSFFRNQKNINGISNDITSIKSSQFTR